MFAWFNVESWADGGELDAPPQTVGMTTLQRKIDSMEWPHNTHIDFHSTNIATHLIMHSQHNHGYGVPEQIDDLITWLGENFSGTHGLIYEHDDEHPVNVGDNAYRVRAMIRGRLAEVHDPYFSPLIPTVGT
jgi:hypothetical protein